MPDIARAEIAAGDDDTTYIVEVRKCELLHCGAERSFHGTSDAEVDRAFTTAGWRNYTCPLHTRRTTNA